MDEAQDLQDEAWMFVSCLAEGKRLIAFHDPGQAFWSDRQAAARSSSSRGSACPGRCAIHRA